MLHIGLDVHKENTVWHAIDGAGLQRGRGELPTREGALGTFLQGHTEKAKFYLEAGTASAWLYRLIAAAGHAAVVVDPNRNRAIATSSKKTDKHDASTLATLGRANLYEPVYVRTEETDASRRMVTARSALVSARGDLIRVVRAFFRGEGRPLQHATTEDFPEVVRQSELLTWSLALVVKPMLKALDALNAEIADYDEQTHQLAVQHKALIARLTAIPGIGENIAVSFLLYVEDTARFATKSQLSAALGLVPMVRESAGKRMEGGITKRGKKSMRALLVQGAWAHLRSKQDTAMKRWAENLMKRGGNKKKKQAVVALARKMAELMWTLWLRGTDYKPFPKQSRRNLEPTPN